MCALNLCCLVSIHFVLLVQANKSGHYANLALKNHPTTGGQSASRSRAKPSMLASKECVDLHGQGLRICSGIITSSDVEHKNICTPSRCRAACCVAVNQCQSKHFLSTSLFDCIAAVLQHDQGSCCTVVNTQGGMFETM